MKRKANITRQLRAAVAAALLGGCFGLSPAAYALPVGGASSTAAIAVNGTTMNITGAENNLITWLDFSIGKGERVAFDAHNYLNYVTGNAASEILGTLSGQGAIYLVNPNGISIGDGAVIDVGTLHLSTADLTGHLNSFSDALSTLNDANSFEGDVVNKGTLTAAKEITVQGKNISFKNIDHVKANGSTNNSNIKVYANTNEITVFAYGKSNNASSRKVPEGEIHVGYKGTTAPTIKYSHNIEPMALKLISTPQELQDIKDKLDGRYMLEKDIDMGGFGNFSPIGNGHHAGTDQDFTGRLDGLNYAIENLTMEFKADDDTATGLFGKIGSSGRVENLILKNGKYNVTGNGLYSGGFVGVHKGILRNVTNDGMKISGNCVQGGGIAGQNCSLIDGATNNAAITINVKKECVGGIVGKNAQATSVIKNSVNTGNITSDKNYIGGIVGLNQKGKVINVSNSGTIMGNSWVGGVIGGNSGEGTLSKAYNEGTITGSGNGTGGVLGGNEGIVEIVYNIGNVSGYLMSGGIVGENGSNTEGKGVVRNAYNTGSVTGQRGNNGGIVGLLAQSSKSYTISGKGHNKGLIENVYNTGQAISNIDTTENGGIAGHIKEGGKVVNAYNAGNINAIGNNVNGTTANVQDISLDELHKASTFSGFSLTADGIWRIYEGRTAPLLTAFMTPLRLADTTLIYDGQAHSIGNLASIDTTKISLPLYTQVGTYKYTGLQSLYSDQSGYNIIAPSDTATLTIEKGAEVTEQSVPATPKTDSSSSSSSFSGSVSTLTPTPALTPTPTPVTEATPSSAPAPVTSEAPAQAVLPAPAATSVPVVAQAIERQLEERGADTRQLEAARSAVTPNVQSSTVATASSIVVTSPVGAIAPAAAASSAESREGSIQSAATPVASARTDLNLSWGTDGLLTLENKGVNAPVSMQVESLAAPAGNNAAAVTATPAAETQTVAQNSNQIGGSGSAAVTVAPAAGEQTVTQNSSQTGGSGSASAAVAPAAGGQTVVQNSSQTGSNSAAGTKTAARDSGQSAGSRENAQEQESTQSDSADTTEKNGENRDNEQRE